jgi:RecG-like helicase
LPPDLIERQKLISRAEALTQIHFPPENAAITDYEHARSMAHIRLIFEEFFGTLSHWLIGAACGRKSQRRSR